MNQVAVRMEGNKYCSNGSFAARQCPGSRFLGHLFGAIASFGIGFFFCIFPYILRRGSPTLKQYTSLSEYVTEPSNRFTFWFGVILMIAGIIALFLYIRDHTGKTYSTRNRSPRYEEYIKKYEELAQQPVTTIKRVKKSEQSAAHSKVNRGALRAAQFFEDHPYQEKKSDWAVAGGIAQGLGGLGAGIAAAVDTVAKNAEIDQRNAERREQAKAFANQVRSSVQRSIEEENRRESQKAPARKKTDKTATIFLNTKFQIKESVSIDGLVTIELDPDKRISGIVKATLYDDQDDVAGECYIPLWSVIIPRKDGFKDYDLMINSGLCYPRPRLVAYKVELNPVALWNE